jgi:thioesterase domain-containing protein/acyl carrier protein
VERKLQSIWEETLGIRPIDLEDSFFELGGHSLLAIKLLDAIEKQFGQTLKLATLFEAPTIRGQATLVRQPGTRAAPTCAVAIQSGGNRLPLFFVSGFGGAILPFHGLAMELGTDQPLYVLDLNSLGDDPGETTLGAIAAQMLADMRKIQPHGPYHLAGFSLGGKVVYEIAQQLHRVGEPVGLLALLDCAAPGSARLRSFPVRTVLHIKHALSFERRHAVAYLVERFKMLKKYVGLATRIEPTVFKSKDIVDQSAAIVRTIESRWQAIYSAWRSYSPAFYPGRMLLIRAGVREPRPGVIIDDEAQMGWGGLVGDGVDVASMHCEHGQMLDAQHARALAALLRERLPARSTAIPEASTRRVVTEA